MKSRLFGGACLLALIATLYSLSPGQPLEDLIPAILGNIKAVPVAMWVTLVGLIGLEVITRRNSAGK
jgi:hypothetical protein